MKPNWEELRAKHRQKMLGVLHAKERDVPCILHPNVPGLRSRANQWRHPISWMPTDIMSHCLHQFALPTKRNTCQQSYDQMCCAPHAGQCSVRQIATPTCYDWHANTCQQVLCLPTPASATFYFWAPKRKTHLQSCIQICSARHAVMCWPVLIPTCFALRGKTCDSIAQHAPLQAVLAVLQSDMLRSMCYDAPACANINMLFAPCANMRCSACKTA